MNIFLFRVNEAKELFNEYSKVKNMYSNEPVPDNETLMKTTLASFLGKVLDVCRELGSKTESEAERNLFRQFAGELTEIFR